MHFKYFPRLSLNVQRVSEGVPLMEAKHTVIYLSLSSICWRNTLITVLVWRTVKIL